MAGDSAAVQNNPETTDKLLGGVTGKGFMPGQSGNPGGRPKRKPVTELYEELLEDPEVRESIKKALKDRLTSGRMVGAIEMKEAADRLEGKVSQTVEVEGELAILTLSERMQRARERAGSGS
jgi:hypothetical protein